MSIILTMAIVNTLLASFDRPTQVRLVQLTVFPSSFTLEAATTITTATSRDLANFVKQGILQQNREGYFFSTTLRVALWKRLTSRQRQVLLLKHAKYFIYEIQNQDNTVTENNKHIKDRDLINKLRNDFFESLNIRFLDILLIFKTIHNFGYVDGADRLFEI